MSSPEFIVARVPFTELNDFDGAVDVVTLGEQYEWAWGLAGCFRALAGPGSGAPIPALPRPGDPHAQSLGYWGALHFLLLYRLGWTHPHRGLQKWFDDGRPAGDATLELIEQIWGRDQTLEIYLAWLLRCRPVFDLGSGRHPWMRSDTVELSVSWEGWLSRYLPSPEASRFEWFHLEGGWDPLHLTSHFTQPESPQTNAELVIPDAARERAMLITSSMQDFYKHLLSRSQRLPMTGVHSWKVDVHVDSVGTLGTYRKSATTGLWFSGRHRTHMMGN